MEASIGLDAQALSAVHVAVVGATPCIQASMFFSEFVPGIVNRAARCEKVRMQVQRWVMRQSFGGKGQLFARAAHTLIPNSPTVVQFVGGAAGTFVCDQMDRVGIPHLDVAVPTETRTCTTLLSTKMGATYPETELVGVAGPVLPEHAEQFIDMLGSCLDRPASHRCALALVGTFPEGERLLCMCAAVFLICPVIHPMLLMCSLDTTELADSSKAVAPISMLALATLRPGARARWSSWTAIATLTVRCKQVTVVWCVFFFVFFSIAPTLLLFSLLYSLGFASMRCIPSCGHLLRLQGSLTC